jgi:hypothetical protein
MATHPSGQGPLRRSRARAWRGPTPTVGSGERGQPRGDVDLDAHEGGPDAVKRCRQDVGQHERHCSGAVHPPSMPGFSYTLNQPQRCGTGGCRSRQIAAPGATQAQPTPAPRDRSRPVGVPPAWSSGGWAPSRAVTSCTKANSEKLAPRGQKTRCAPYAPNDWARAGSRSSRGTRSHPR